MRAGPDDSFMFEHGQCATDVPVWASSSISRSSSQTQCATTVRSVRIPRWWNTSRGRRPKRFSDSCTSQIDSDEWVWSPVSNSSASVSASRKHCSRAVEEVLEPDPRAHPAVGRGAVGLEQPPVRLDRLEVVEAVLVGHVRDQGGAEADGLGRRGRTLHEAPHVHHRRRAREHALGVAVERGHGGDLRRQRLVRGVDVGLEPVPQRHRLRGAAQEAGVQVGVVQAGDHGAPGGVDHGGAGRPRVGVELRHPADGDDGLAVDEDRPGIEGGRPSGHGQHDPVADERGHRPTVAARQQTVNVSGAQFTQQSHTTDPVAWRGLKGER